MSKLEILFYVVIVAVLILLFSGCDCHGSKWRVTLPDGRSCVGTVHYSGKGRTDFHCDDGVVFINITNARMVRY